MADGSSADAEGVASQVSLLLSFPLPLSLPLLLPLSLLLLLLFPPSPLSVLELSLLLLPELWSSWGLGAPRTGVNDPRANKRRALEKYMAAASCSDWDLGEAVTRSAEGRKVDRCGEGCFCLVM